MWIVWYDKGYRTVKDILNGRWFIDPVDQNLNLSNNESEKLQIIIDSVTRRKLNKERLDLED